MTWFQIAWMHELLGRQSPADAARVRAASEARQVASRELVRGAVSLAGAARRSAA